ncbi:MAG: hypothetical protein OZ917_06380 [Candidatus Brocadiaceae bacterium]|nr:hypothetical protein [Candidatus Brocadiaceae bacterium]
MKQEKRGKMAEMVSHFVREFLNLDEDVKHNQQLPNRAVSA